MKNIYNKVKIWYTSLSIEKKFSFVFSFLLLFFSFFTTIITSIFDLDNKWTIRAISMILSCIAFGNLWEQYILFINLEKKIDNFIDLKKPLSFRYKIEEDYPLNLMWDECSSIKIASMGSTQLFTAKRDLLNKSILNGTVFEFILMSPTSEAMKEHLKNKCDDDFGLVNISVKNIQTAINNLGSNEMVSGKNFFYYTEINLPYAIMIVEKKDVQKSFIKIDLYAIGVKDSDRPSFIIYKEDEMYDFFYAQYMLIKKESKRIDKIQSM